MLDFHIDDSEAKHALMNAIWANKDRLRFTFFREEFRRKCKITLSLGKYIIRAEIPFIRENRMILFNVYKCKVFGLYKSYFGGMLLEYHYDDSLESLIENYVDVKVKELKKDVYEAEEAAQRKINAEFIDHLKENCSTSD